MIGQTKIIDKINSFSYIDLPCSTLLVGDRGSGKHAICNYMSNYYDVPLLDISTEISKDKIDEIYTQSIPAIYVIDIALASKSKKIVNLQNIILKFIEEPPASCKIVILAESKNQVLDTVLNRCQIWCLKKYSLEELRQFSEEFTDEELILLSTPGNIKSISHQVLTNINRLCDNIINNINRAGISNTLSIANKINFNNEDKEDTFDLDIFLLCLRNKLSKTSYTEAFMLTKLMMENSRIFNINKRYLFEKYLLDLKEAFNETRGI